MFPEKQRPPGTVSVAAHGHHDAGDYSKYTVSGSMFVAVALLPYANKTLAARLARDDGQIPEAHNGIPDILDEVHPTTATAYVMIMSIIYRHPSLYSHSHLHPRTHPPRFVELPTIHNHLSQP
jgi:hypothetical protein